jgi:hypothetical protein
VTANEYEEHARVMRVSLMRGEVSLRRAGNVEWERAKLNLPLVEGDTLATGADSRLEIQVDAHNFVRVGADSVLRVVSLREEGVAFSLSEGTATLRLKEFDHEREYFEIDAPRTTMAAERRGLYRLDVARDGSVRVTVRDDGRARLYSENSGFVLRNNRAARLYYEAGEGDWELSAAPAFDEWDDWNDERERYLASRLRYENRERYYDREVWGAEELDAYGDWSHTSQYGWVWRPHVTVINHYYNWAPYRYGHWRWCPPYGWTWVADEDWGWAPYHYGRWVVYNNNWCWAPRGYGYNYRRAWWRPALVAFVYIPTAYGEHVAWYPLRHGQYDPRGRWWNRRPERLAPLRAHEIANLERSNPLFLRAVTSLPAREFGAGSPRARAAANDIARRAVTGEPVRGRLPITPADVGRDTARPSGRQRVLGARGGDASEGQTATRPPTRDGGLRIVRPDAVTPSRAIPERATGAAARTPGVPLDGELRRTRVLNGRELLRPPAPAAESEARNIDHGTGAVTRPARPERLRPAERVAPPVETDRAAPSPGPTAPLRTRPERTRPAERDDADDVRPPRPTRPSAPSEDATPSKPRVYERTSPRVREYPGPAERTSPRPVETPAQRDERRAPREERPAPRVERPQPREERPAPREERPAPRYEPPAERSAPPPRQERPAPTPREERPAPAAPPQQERQAPPPRNNERPARPARQKQTPVEPT